MIVVWAAIMLLSVAGRAQEKPSASKSLYSGSNDESPNPVPSEGQRIKTLEDQVHVFALLDPARIGLALSEEYQLVPEQSTSALVCHHPEARYFNVG